MKKSEKIILKQSIKKEGVEVFTIKLVKKNIAGNKMDYFYQIVVNNFKKDFIDNVWSRNLKEVKRQYKLKVTELRNFIKDQDGK